MAFVLGNVNALKGVRDGSRATCSRSGRKMVVSAKMDLKIQQEKLPGSQVSLKITVPAQDAKKAYDKFVSSLVKQSNLPGFRKGGAPKQLVINTAGKERIAAGVVEELVESSAKEALETEGISAVGQSSLEDDVDGLITSFSEKTDFVYKLKVEVWPESSFKEEYKSRSVQVEVEQFDESLVADALEEFRKREATYVKAPADYVVNWGDQALANMKGFYRTESEEKGDPLPDFADGEGVEIIVESGKYMEGFAEGLIGVKAGETKSVKVQFPEGGRRELAGLKAIFDVTVLEVRNQQLPELNDELAMTAAGKKDLQELRDEIKNRLSFEVDNSNDAAVVKAVEDELETIIEVELPSTLVEQQTKQKFATMMSDFKDQGMPDEQVKSMISQENYEKYAKNARKNVESMLRKSFAIQQIAETEGVTVADEDVDDQIDLLRQEMKDELDEESAREKVFANLQRDAVIEILKSTWTITKVKKAPIE